MNTTPINTVIGRLLDDSSLGLDEFAHAVCVDTPWVIERVEAGFFDITPGNGDSPTQWRFASTHVVRARRMAFVESSLDTNPEVAALVADLEEEIARLRRQLAR